MSIGNGLTRFEEQVMDLWDAKMGTQAIADRLDIDVSRVRKVVSCFGSSLAEDRMHAAMMERGSAALLGAIASARGAQL